MKRTDIHSILVIGAGPIVIGQACEFDYSGVQACKVLRREGYRVILVNSNPATIMTDPEFADATYIEPLTPDSVEQIIIKEKPDAVLPTVGGQTALNLAMDLHRQGILAKHGVILLGAQPEAIDLAEDRLKFKEAMLKAGLSLPKGDVARTVEEAQKIADEVGLPCLIRPSFTLGGSGGGIVFTPEEFQRKVEHGLRESPVHEVLIEQSVLGWKEYELEVMRDCKNNFVVVCSIENLDPMGVHTGDSITVAPAQTLTDREYQRLRDQARVVMNTVGVETGGSNVQFAVNPKNGDVVIIEMNPRVSRSSALASKATGFPIAKIAALLAVGYSLDEIPNDITRVTPASFEPSIDYCVVKFPRWAFEKFPGADPTLGPQMKSVGEVMAIGRTFPEAMNKALRGLELKIETDKWTLGDDLSQLGIPTAQRFFKVLDAMRAGVSQADICAITHFDPWFVCQLGLIVAMENEIKQWGIGNREQGLGIKDQGLGIRDSASIPNPQSLISNLQSLILNPQSPIAQSLIPILQKAKRMGVSDLRIAQLLNHTFTHSHNHAFDLMSVRKLRLAHDIRAKFYRVDTCAAEFEAHTPYLYSHYERLDESEPTNKRKIVILGGGPNRIGQGIEFDYCCVQACLSLREMGIETIMINCNPETVSTDYDTADRLYFEPLTLEDVLNVIDTEKPEGVIVQFGGQTPINLTRGLAAAGVPILGTTPDAIDLAEDRIRFGNLLTELDIPSPAWGAATSLEEAKAIAQRIGYPVLVRPSYVIGGRAMEIAHDDEMLAKFLIEATRVSEANAAGKITVLIDHYLEDSFEADVDAIGDGENVVVVGVMEHIEEAGVHSGDSACVLPPIKISAFHDAIMRDYTERLGVALKVKGLMNVQYAIKDEIVYVLEVNPRASRTVPYVSKATGYPIAKYAAQIMGGKTLSDLNFTESPDVEGFHIKEVVLPFKKFPGADYRLGPEMKSTGEVMGSADSFGHAFAKAQLMAGAPLPTNGNALITVNDFDKGAVVKIARDLHRLGFGLIATAGTASMLTRVGLPVTIANKVHEGGSHTVELVKHGQVQLIINTPMGAHAQDDSRAMRMAAVLHGVPLLTTLSAATAAVQGIAALKKGKLTVQSLQERIGKK